MAHEHEAEEDAVAQRLAQTRQVLTAEFATPNGKTALAAFNIEDGEDAVDLFLKEADKNAAAEAYLNVLMQRADSPQMGMEDYSMMAQMQQIPGMAAVLGMIEGGIQAQSGLSPGVWLPASEVLKNPNATGYLQYQEDSDTKELIFTGQTIGLNVPTRQELAAFAGTIDPRRGQEGDPTGWPARVDGLSPFTIDDPPEGYTRIKKFVPGVGEVWETVKSITPSLEQQMAKALEVGDKPEAQRLWDFANQPTTRFDDPTLEMRNRIALLAASPDPADRLEAQRLWDFANQPTKTDLYNMAIEAGSTPTNFFNAMNLQRRMDNAVLGDSVVAPFSDLPGERGWETVHNLLNNLFRGGTDTIPPPTIPDEKDVPGTEATTSLGEAPGDPEAHWRKVEKAKQEQRRMGPQGVSFSDYVLPRDPSYEPDSLFTSGAGSPGATTSVSPDDALAAWVASQNGAPGANVISPNLVGGGNGYYGDFPVADSIISGGPGYVPGSPFTAYEIPPPGRPLSPDEDFQRVQKDMKRSNRVPAPKWQSLYGDLTSDNFFDKWDESPLSLKLGARGDTSEEFPSPLDSPLADLVAAPLGLGGAPGRRFEGHRGWRNVPTFYERAIEAARMKDFEQARMARFRAAVGTPPPSPTPVPPPQYKDWPYRAAPQFYEESIRFQ